MKIKFPFLTPTADLKDRELNHLIDKLTACGIYCCTTENHDAAVRLDDNEVNFLREISIWWRNVK